MSRTDAAPARPPEEDLARAGVRFSVRRLLIALSPSVLLGTLIAFEVPICPSRTLLGIPCPGCGLTRATEAAMTGDLTSMLQFHPLAPIVTPIFLFVIARITLVGAGLVPKNRFDLLSKLPNWVWTTLGVALIGLWILRLFGLLGGTADPVDLTAGLIYRGASSIWHLFAG